MWRGRVDRKGYGRLSLAGREMAAHRVSFAVAVRPLMRGECVCHRCDTPACIEPTHLFAGSIADNNADRDAKGRSVVVKGPRASLYSNNRSGTTGVSFRKRDNRWRAYIKVEGKHIDLGTTRSFEEALVLRLKAEADYRNLLTAR